MSELTSPVFSDNIMLCVCMRQLRQVRDYLDGLWSVGSVVLFTWMSFLQNELYDALSLSSPLSIATAEALSSIIDHNNSLSYQVTALQTIKRQTTASCGCMAVGQSP